MNQAVEFKCIETHAEVLIWDPFPTIEKKRYDRCSCESIVAACVDQYKDDLIAIVIYEISVIKVNGVEFKSEPLNKQRWSKHG